MLFIKPNVEECTQNDFTLEGAYSQVDKIVKFYPKSSDFLSDIESGKTRNNLYSIYEFGDIYLRLTPNMKDSNILAEKYGNNEFSFVNKTVQSGNPLNIDTRISTTLRVITENRWMDDLKYITTPDEKFEKRYSFHITTDIGIATGLLAHKRMSLVFGKVVWNTCDTEIACIETPLLASKAEVDSQAYESVYEIISSAYEEAEGYYQMLVNSGIKPELAKIVLPLGTKVEVFMAGYKSDWDDFLKRRLVKTENPDMMYIAVSIKNILDSKNEN